MIFNDVVKKAVEETPGAVAALLMGSDGISLAGYSDPAAELEMEVVGIEYATLLSEVRKVAEILESGDLKELTISTERYTIIIRSVTEEYFIALAVLPDGNMGKGRFLLRVNSPTIRKELY